MEGNPLDIIIQILFLPFRILGELLNSLSAYQTPQLLPRKSSKSLIVREYLSDSNIRDENYNQQITYQRPSTYRPQHPIQPTNVLAPRSPTSPTYYDNNEEWEIEWTPDGLPKRIVVSRHAVNKNG